MHLDLVFRFNKYFTNDDYFVTFPGGMRIALEREIAAAKIDNEKQRLVMRNAIEGLAKQVAGA